MNFETGDRIIAELFGYCEPCGATLSMLAASPVGQELREVETRAAIRESPEGVGILFAVQIALPSGIP